MSQGYYTSDTPVSQRVDRAWHQGYVVGREEWKRVAVVSTLFAAYELVKGRRVPTLVKVVVVYGLLLATLLALCALPIVAVVLGVRLYLRHRPAKAELVEMDDGTVF